MYATCTMRVTVQSRGEPAAGVVVQARLVKMPSGTGSAEVQPLWEVESVEDGVAEFAGAIQGAEYQICVRGGAAVSYTTTTEAEQDIPNVFGVG